LISVPSEDGAGIPFTVLLIASPLLFRLLALPVDGETAVSSLDILSTLVAAALNVA